MKFIPRPLLLSNLSLMTRQTPLAHRRSGMPVSHCLHIPLMIASSMEPWRHSLWALLQRICELSLVSISYVIPNLHYGTICFSTTFPYTAWSSIKKTNSNYNCRTYPTWYDIFYNYSATFQSLATITGNGTSSVICTGEWKSYTEAFANTTEGPNGDYSPSTVVDALNAFTSSAFPGCTLDAKPVLAAPSTKVRVSQVTATSTRHVATLPDDGTGLSAESGGPGVPASPTSCGEYAITYTHTSGLEVTTGCIGAAASGPVVHHTVTGGLHPTPSKSEQQTGAGSVTKKPVYGGITLPFFGPIGARPTEQPSPRPTGSPGSGGDSGGQPVVALPITQSPSQGQGESSDQDGSNDQDGFNDQDESILPSPTIVTPPAQITINSKTYTLNPSSQFIIGSQTLSAGSHEITINGHTLSLASSASSIIIDGSTHAISYPPVTTLSPTAAPILTINHQPVTANSASEYVIGSQTLIPGGSAITISGTPVSLASSAADVVVGSSSTQALGEIIMGGFGPGGTAGSGGSGSGSANSTSTTSPEAFTGGAALVKKIHNWGVVLAGIGFGMVMG